MYLIKQTQIAAKLFVLYLFEFVYSNQKEKATAKTTKENATSKRKNTLH